MFMMKAAIDGLAARASAGLAGQICGMLGNLIDCVIPIALVSVIVIGSPSIVFGVLN